MSGKTLCSCTILFLAMCVGRAAEPTFTPSSEYKQYVIGGVTVNVHPRVLEHPKEAERALKEFEKRIDLIGSVVSAEHMEAFRKVPIWLKWDSDTTGKYEFGQFNHPKSREHLKQKGFNPDVAGAIEFPNTGNFMKQPKWGVLHEMAHAYHFLVLGENHAGIDAAYKQAMERKLYDNLYAATNPYEYFAELTVVYFGQGNYYPYVRDELRTHDPDGFRALEQVWGTPPTNPSEAARLRVKGTGLLRQGDYHEAIDVLSRSILRNPDDFLAYNERGAAYTFLNNDAAAIKDFSRSIALNDRFAIAYRNRGAAYLRRRNVDEALADLNRAIDLRPHYARAFRDRAAVYRHLRYLDRADKDEKEATRLEGRKP